jgi:opacity protein-like surface antigen
MKNLLLVLLLSLIFGLALHAQTYAATENSSSTLFGVKGGLNISRIAGDDAYDSSDPRWGWHFGALVQYNIMKSLSFQPELLYSQKGYSYKFSIADLNTKVEDSYDYLEIPLLLKLNLSAPRVKIQPYLGPTISYLIAAESKITSTVGSFSTTETHKIKDDMNHFDLGITFGTDIVLLDRVALGARYNIGMSKIYKDSMTDIGTDVQNGTFMLNLGYMFNQ